MWRLLGSSLHQTSAAAGWMQQAWVVALLQQPQLPAQVCRSSSAAATALQQLVQQQVFCSLPGQHCTSRSHSTTTSSSSSSTPPHEGEGHQQQQAEQPVGQPGPTGPSSSSQLRSKSPSAAAGRSRQLASIAEQSGFVTLPPHATPSGYPESFSGSTSSSSSSGTQSTVSIEQVQLPQERLRIQLRQEVQEEEEARGEDVDAYSLSRSLISDAHSFDTAAAAATAADKTPQQQQQQQALSADDRVLLEKLVGIMTKEGKKSRARRLLLDAMHIIKQQVAKGQAAP